MKNPKYLPLLLASAALFGCTVGPRFEPPAVAIPQRYIGQVSDCLLYTSDAADEL